MTYEIKHKHNRTYEAMPWGGPHLSVNYDPTHDTRTKALLHGSLVPFSQSCPLIALPDEVVDRHAEAFARVWQRRTALAEWAARRSS